MRILHITPRNFHSAIWDLVYRQRERYDILLAWMNLLDNDTCKISKEYIKWGVSFINIETKKIVDFTYNFKLRELFYFLFKKYKPHLIHIHLFSGVSVIPILNVAASLHIRRVITLHDHSLCCVKGVLYDDKKICKIQSLAKCDCRECKEFASRENKTLLEYNYLREKRMKTIIAMCDQIICCSFTQKDMFTNLSSCNTKFNTLYCGVALPCINKNFIIIKKDKSMPVFGYLGSLNYLKGIATIEGALKYLKKYKFRILMGIFFNSNNQQDAVYFHKLKRNSKLRLLVNIPYKRLYPEFFSQIDYLIIPSLWEETGPMTLFESFFYKVPVIISNRSSMVEKIRENKSSRVFHNTEELAKIMKEIIEGTIKKKENDIFKVIDIKKYLEKIDVLYKDVTSKQPKTLNLNIGYLCNNMCIFCVTGDNYPNTFINFEIIKSRLEKYRENYDEVVLTGGEPAIREDFLMILESAYRLGYKVKVQTNARIFSKKSICEKIKYYNLDIITHVESYKSRIHDSLSRVPGSFNETIKGIKNLRKYCKSIAVKIMITKINYKHLLYTLKFITRLNKINCIWFVFPTPYGNSYRYFNAIVPSYSEVAPFINYALGWLRDNSESDIMIEGFPYCFVNPEFRCFIKEEPIEDKDNILGIYPSDSNTEEQIYCICKERIKQKQKFIQCKKCKYNSICEGVYKNYINKMGDNEFVPIK